MSSARIRKPEPCAVENCGSKRFYIGEDGYTYCDQGHQQSERGAVIAEDTGELVIHGQKSRRRDSDAESRTSRASSFSGADAFEHYLLCLQLVVRKQLRWLIDVQKLPGELESLTKDLWVLRLQKIQGKISYDSETDTEAFSSQGFSSQSENETGSASQSSRRSKKDEKKRAGTLALEDTISLCYIAILLLRIPVTVADIYQWINDGKFLYYRASREVPLGMRERLPPGYQALLEPQDMLQSELLHRHILDTAVLFNNDFGMAMPPLNVSLVLYRWIQALMLPLEIFAATQRLARLLDVDLSTWIASKASRIIVLRYPEAQLMAVVIVATKLLYPLDDIERKAYQPTDLSSLALDWDAWAKLHKPESENPAERPRLSFYQAFEFSETDCLSTSDEKLDAYLDWYEDNVASEEVRERGRARNDAEFRRTLFQMFPTHCRQQKDKTKETSAAINRLHDAQGTLLQERAVQPQESKTVNRVGSFYRRYRTVEELSGPATILFEKAAGLAGISVESLVQAVFLTERKLQKYEDGLRKAAKAVEPG